MCARPQRNATQRNATMLRTLTQVRGSLDSIPRPARSPQKSLRSWPPSCPVLHRSRFHRACTHLVLFFWFSSAVIPFFFCLSDALRTLFLRSARSAQRCCRRRRGGG